MKHNAWTSQIRMEQAGDRIRHFLFPARCVGCDRILDVPESELCPDCRKAWREALAVPCPVCGKPQSFCRCGPSEKLLSRVSDAERSCLRFYHAVPYGTGVVQSVLLRIKDEPDTDTVRFAAKTMSLLCLCACEEASVRCPGLTKEDWLVTYAPRSPKKERQTGHDHMKLVSRRAAELSGLAFAELLVRTRASAEQKTLRTEGRMRNAETTCRLSADAEPVIRGRHILLLDDIMTTGATLLACAVLLLRAGASEVVCVTAAKTPPPGGEPRGGT